MSGDKSDRTIPHLQRTNFCVYYFCELKKTYFASTYFFEWQVFENVKFINFSLIENRIRKGSWIKGYVANFSFKINGKTGRSRWKNCCYWLILKKKKIFLNLKGIWIFCILSVYLFSETLFKGFDQISRNWLKNIHAKISTLKVYIPQFSIRWHHQKLRILF